MAAYNPRLDFYRVLLNHKDDEFKTFHDFMCEVLNKKRVNTSKQLLVSLSDYLVSSLQGDMAVDTKTNKQVRWLNKNANIYRTYRPKPDENSDSIIYGVLSGGRYGRNGMITSKEVSEDEGSTSALKPNSAVHKYCYFALYAPMDHNEGCLVVHSNSRDESVADVIVKLITRMFYKGQYKKPSVSRFCPQYLQQQFKDRSVLKQINIRNSYISKDIDNIGVQNKDQDPFNNYSVQIIITPYHQSEDVQSDVNNARNLLSRLGFVRNTATTSLDKFKMRKVTMEDSTTKHVQTFEIDKDEIELCPIIDVRSILPNDEDYQIDGTPLIDKLHGAVIQILQNQVIPELRGNV